jgi:hypothetical protein
MKSFNQSDISGFVTKFISDNGSKDLVDKWNSQGNQVSFSTFVENLSNMNIRCVTYKDKFSSKSSAYNDLMLGYENKVVGCSSKIFGASKKNDIVIINVKKNGIIHAIIVRLDTKLDECNVWINQGGLKWEYNWTYEPITDIFQYDNKTKNEMINFCTIHSLKHKNLFHPRFCSILLKKAVDVLIKKFSLA